MRLSQLLLISPALCVCDSLAAIVNNNNGGGTIVNNNNNGGGGDITNNNNNFGGGTVVNNNNNGGGGDITNNNGGGGSGPPNASGISHTTGQSSGALSAISTAASSQKYAISFQMQPLC
jgi:hypothetical protein